MTWRRDRWRKKNQDDRHPYKYSVQFSLCMHGTQNENEMFGGLGILSKANPRIYIVTPDIITIFPSEANDSHISRWHAKCAERRNAWRCGHSEYTNWRTTHACIMKGVKKKNLGLWKLPILYTNPITGCLGWQHNVVRENKITHNAICSGGLMSGVGQEFMLASGSKMALCPSLFS